VVLKNPAEKYVIHFKKIIKNVETNFKIFLLEQNQAIAMF
jgi:hypothetical protein